LGGWGLQLRTEGEKTAVTILHHKLARFPWHVGEPASELHASGSVLGEQRVSIFDEYVGVQKFVRIFIRIGCGRRGAAEMNRVLVPRDNCVD
jgi:hypothetical protein